MHLEVHAIEVVAVGGGLVPEGSPLLRALNGFARGFARLNLRDVLAVGKINNTDKACNHSQLPLFLTLILYHKFGKMSRGFGKIIVRQIAQIFERKIVETIQIAQNRRVLTEDAPFAEKGKRRDLLAFVDDGFCATEDKIADEEDADRPPKCESRPTEQRHKHRIP